MHRLRSFAQLRTHAQPLSRQFRAVKHLQRILPQRSANVVARPTASQPQRRSISVFKSRPAPEKRKSTGVLLGYWKNKQGDIQISKAGKKIDQNNSLLSVVKNSGRKAASEEGTLLAFVNSENFRGVSGFPSLAPNENIKVGLVSLGEEKKTGNKTQFLRSFRKQISQGISLLQSQGVNDFWIDKFDTGCAFDTCAENAKVFQNADHFQNLCLQAAAEASETTLYDYKEDKKDVSINGLELSQQEQAFFDKGKWLGYSQNIAKRLADTPSNMLTPTKFSEFSRTLLESLSPANNLQVHVHDFDFIKSQKMGMLEGVGKGSSEEPRIFEAVYRGNPSSDQIDVVLVGKGVTFDTGGINLKPDVHMSDMKGDMGGAAVVMTTIHALHGLTVPLNVVAVCGLAENMPDGKALKPEDVLTSMKGLTVEIGNTDAEGRLVLGDCMTYAQRKYKPRYIFDVATLTGAVHVALSNQATGVFTDSNELWEVISRAGDQTSDRFWRLPLYPEFQTALKSRVADLNNIAKAGTGGGSCTAATFLQNFVDTADPVEPESPEDAQTSSEKSKVTKFQNENYKGWAHFDIAGVMVKGNEGKMTGEPMRGIVNLLENLSPK